MPRITLGDVYLIPTPPNGSHYYVAIAVINSNCYLFINYSTVQDSTPDEDTEYILRPSRNLPRFLCVDSYFVFSDAEEFSSSSLDRLISQRVCKHQGAFPLSVVKEIQLAGVSSGSIRSEYRDLLKTCLGL